MTFRLSDFGWSLLYVFLTWIKISSKSKISENLDVLLAHGYKVDKSTVKDMFPNTAHAETVVKLTKRH